MFYFQMEVEASKIGFRSEWGRSIGQIHPGGYTPPPMHEYRELDDGDDDQPVSLDVDLSNIRLL